RNLYRVIEDRRETLNDRTAACSPSRFLRNFGFEATARDRADCIAIGRNQQTGTWAAVTGAFYADQGDESRGIPLLPTFDDRSTLPHSSLHQWHRLEARLRLFAESMDATLQLSSAPSATARIRTSNRASRARLAANAGVAFIVERESRNVMLASVGLDAIAGPVFQTANLLHLFPGWQAVILELVQIGARGRLLTTEACEPPGEGFERPHERLDFADLAALRRIDDVEQTELRLVFCNGGQRKRVDKVELPVADQAIAVFEECREVITGLEKNYGNIAQVPAKEMENDHVLGLKAAGDANVAAGGETDNVSDQLLRSQSLHIGKLVQHGIAHCCSFIHAWSSSSCSIHPSPAIFLMASRTAGCRGARVDMAGTRASCRARTTAGKVNSGISGSSTSTSILCACWRISRTRSAAPGSPGNQRNAGSGLEETGVFRLLFADAAIMPAATVALVIGSIRMKDPSGRLSS